MWSSSIHLICTLSTCLVPLLTRLNAKLRSLHCLLALINSLVLASIQIFHRLMSRPYCHFCPSIDYLIDIPTPIVVISFNLVWNRPNIKNLRHLQSPQIPTIIDRLPHSSEHSGLQSLGHLPSTTESMIPTLGWSDATTTEATFLSMILLLTVRKERKEPPTFPSWPSAVVISLNPCDLTWILSDPLYKLWFTYYVISFSWHSHWNARTRWPPTPLPFRGSRELVKMRNGILMRWRYLSLPVRWSSLKDTELESVSRNTAGRYWLACSIPTLGIIGTSIN